MRTDGAQASEDLAGQKTESDETGGLEGMTEQNRERLDAPTPQIHQVLINRRKRPRHPVDNDGSPLKKLKDVIR